MICEKADDETETDLSLEKQLSDAKEKIDDLEDTISKLQEQLKVFMKEENDNFEVKSEPELVRSNENDDDDVRFIFILY